MRLMSSLYAGAVALACTPGYYGHDSVPVYPAPEYSYPAPAPVYPAPDYATPIYPAPGYGVPVYPAPVYPSPVYPAPVYPDPVYPPDYGKPVPPTGPSFIRIAEGPCFGFCPVYSMTVYPDDSYQLEKQQFTVDPGTTNGTVPGAYAAGVAALAASNFDTLPTDITIGNPATCPNPATDLPTVEFERGDPGAKEITYYQGCFGSPVRATLEQLRTDLRNAFDVESLVVGSGPS